MKSEWYGDKALNAITREVLDRLEMVGVMVRDAAVALTKTGKYPPGSGKAGGFLKSQMYYKVNPATMSVIIGNNATYAAIQEFGGDIRPKKGKALAVPIHGEAVGRSPRDFSDLVMIKPKNGHPLLVRMKGKDDFDAFYVLVPKVTIPANPFLRPAIIENRPAILNLLQTGDGNITVSMGGKEL